MKKVFPYALCLLGLCSCHRFIEPNIQIGSTTLSVGDTTYIEWSDVKSIEISQLHPENAICALTDSANNTVHVIALNPGIDTIHLEYDFIHFHRPTGAPGFMQVVFFTVLPKE